GEGKTKRLSKKARAKNGNFASQSKEGDAVTPSRPYFLSVATSGCQQFVSAYRCCCSSRRSPEDRTTRKNSGILVGTSAHAELTCKRCLSHACRRIVCCARHVARKQRHRIEFVPGDVIFDLENNSYDPNDHGVDLHALSGKPKNVSKQRRATTKPLP